MKVIKMFSEVGSFAEDKDTAAKIRKNEILPTLKARKQIILDFAGVTLVTQSFIHALIAEALRTYSADFLEHVEFKNCDGVAREIISTVVQYVLDTLEDNIM